MPHQLLFSTRRSSTSTFPSASLQSITEPQCMTQGGLKQALSHQLLCNPSLNHSAWHKAVSNMHFPASSSAMHHWTRVHDKKRSHTSTFPTTGCSTVNHWNTVHDKMRSPKSISSSASLPSIIEPQCKTNGGLLQAFPNQLLYSPSLNHSAWQKAAFYKHFPTSFSAIHLLTRHDTRRSRTSISQQASL
jgi:hypothetical protein